MSPLPRDLVGRNRLDPSIASNRIQTDSRATVRCQVLPRPFGRYQLTRILGQGSMGCVYLARDVALNRDVALKIPTITGGGDHGKLLERFAREARAAAAIEHPHICPIYEVGNHEGQPFIAMMLVTGITLSDMIEDSDGIEPRLAMTLIRKISSALAEAHDHGIIHRDLKPANIMMNRRNEPIVMDFGIAREIDNEDQEQLTQDGMIVGTLAYMSPEQIDGIQDNVGRPSDIYSLGVVFYELLTGRVPFTGRTMSLMSQIATKSPPPPTSIRKDLSPQIEAVCLKMMDKRVSHRHDSMYQVADELAALLGGDAVFGGDAETVLGGRLVPSTDTGPIEGPVTGEQLKLQSSQVHALINASNWPAAERLLVKMESNTSPIAENYAKWAREQLVTVRNTLQKKRREAENALLQAQSRIKRHDYVGALGLLSKVPRSMRTPTAKHLLDNAVESQTKVDALFKQIDRNFRTGQLGGTLPHLQQLLELKPNDVVAQYLFRKYRWQSRFGFSAGWLADAFAPTQSQVARLTYEEPFLRKWLGITALVFFTFAIGTATAVTLRIKNRARKDLRVVTTEEPRPDIHLDEAPNRDDQRVESNATRDQPETDPVQPSAGQPVPTIETISEPPSQPIDLPNDKGQYVGILNGEYRTPFMMMFSSDSQRILAMCHTEETFRVWDTNSRDQVHSRAVEQPAGRFDLAEDGSLFVAATSKIHQFQLRSMTPLVALPEQPCYRRAVCVSRDATWVLTAGSKTTDKLWKRMDDGTYRKAHSFFGGNYGINALAYVDSPPRFLIAGTDLPFRILHLSDDFRLQTLDLPELSRTYLETISVSPDNIEFLHQVKGGGWVARSIEDGRVVRKYDVDARWLGFHPDDRSLVGFIKNEAVGVFDKQSGRLVNRMELPAAFLLDGMNFKTAISPDGRYVVASGYVKSDPSTDERDPGNPTVHVWEFPSSMWKESEDAHQSLEKVSPPRPIPTPKLVPTSMTPAIPPELFPFDAKEAKRRQEAAAKSLGIPVEYTNRIGMKFRLIPAGEFLMGSPESEHGRGKDEQQHRVRITQPFYLGVTEVTQAQWAATMTSNLWTKRLAIAGAGNVAVGNVGLNAAIKFCRKIKRKPGENYRLPTESEWEYACRGGSETSYHFGDDASQLNDYAWLSRNDVKGLQYIHSFAHSVAQKKPNPFGVYDMYGNVKEWCSDPYEQNYVQTSHERTTPDVRQRIVRGGSWLENSRQGSYRSAARGQHQQLTYGEGFPYMVGGLGTPQFRHLARGLRVVLEVP